MSFSLCYFAHTVKQKKKQFKKAWNGEIQAMEYTVPQNSMGQNIVYIFNYHRDGATKKPSQFMKPQKSVYKKMFVLMNKTVSVNTTNRFKLHLILKITMS